MLGLMTICNWLLRTKVDIGSIDKAPKDDTNNDGASGQRIRLLRDTFERWKGDEGIGDIFRFAVCIVL